MKDKTNLISSLIAMLLPLLSFIYFVFIGVTNERGVLGLYTTPVLLIVFIVSCFQFMLLYKIGGNLYKKEMGYFALVAVLIATIFCAPIVYRDCYKEPSYLVSEIVKSTLASKTSGDVTKHMNSEILERIKSGGAPYLVSQDFELNSQVDGLKASFNKIVKRQPVKIKILLENNGVKVVVYTGYPTL